MTTAPEQKTAPTTAYTRWCVRLSERFGDNRVIDMDRRDTVQAVIALTITVLIIGGIVAELIFVIIPWSIAHQ